MISVLTVNYHSSADLRGLVDSLTQHGGDEPLELVVTNNSPSDRLDFLNERDAASGMVEARVIESGNVGFGAGINQAYRASRGELLMIANPDVRIGEATLHRARAYLKANDDVGIVLPLLRYPDGEVQPSVRRFYTWAVVMFARSPLRALGMRPGFFRHYLCEDVDLKRPTDVDWGLGAAMFLRRGDVQEEQGGIFDERFFLYFEDVDLCYRTWQRGRRVVYCPQIECVHDHRRSSARTISRAGWHHFRSTLKFVSKHGGLPVRPKLTC